jgi:hypothetical protein
MVVFLTAIMPLLLRVITTLGWVVGVQSILTQVTGQPGVAMAQVTGAVKDGVQNTVSAASGGLVPPAPQAVTPGSSPALPTPSTAAVVVQSVTNPWLYVAIGGLLLFATTLTKQTRGLARDVGGGIATTRGAVREDFDDLGSDPSRGKR